MDYIPPERPALIAQARDEERRGAGKICYTGQIDQMDLLDDFHSLGTFEDWDRQRKHGLKLGQYFPLCQSDDNQLTFYVQEHKPCSVPTFAAFRALTKLNRPDDPWLPEKQIGLVTEILGDKLDKSKFDLKARVDDVGGRKVLEVATISRQKPTLVGRAYLVVSDAKNRVIEEIGFKGAKKENRYWLDEAGSMLASVKFIKESTQRP